MTVIKQKAVSSSRHAKNVRKYINGKDALARGGWNLPYNKYWYAKMARTRKSFGHDKPARAGAKNTIMDHEMEEEEGGSAFEEEIDPDESDQQEQAVIPKSQTPFLSDKDTPESYGELDGDLFALIGADCDGSSGLEGLLVIDIPNVELGAGEDIIGTENGLVDLYLGRLVLLLYGSGHEIGLVVLIGKGELDRGRIEHMALRSLGLDEGIGCGTGTEIKFLGGGGSIVTGGHMVDDLSLGRTHGAIGGDDILLRDDIVLCIFEILAVIGAGLGDGRLPHDLPVEDLYDGDGRGVFVVLGDLETDRLAVEQIRGGGGDFLDGVLAGLQLSGHGNLTVRVGGERVNLVFDLDESKRFELVSISIESRLADTELPDNLTGRGWCAIIE